LPAGRHQIRSRTAERDTGCRSRAVTRALNSGFSDVQEAHIFQWRSLKTRVTIFTLAIFLVSLWSLAFYAGRMLRQDMQRLLGEQQFSTVTFVAATLEDELKDRLQALEQSAGSIDSRMLDRPAALQQFLEQRPILQVLFNAGVVALTPAGRALAAVPVSSATPGADYLTREVIAATLKEGRSMISEPVTGGRLKQPAFAMLAPIRDQHGQVIAVLLGRINLGSPNFLDRITANRYGKSGGYLLIDPQRRLIVTATDKSRNMEVLPAPGINPVIDRFIEGFEGSAVMVNPPGVEALVSDKRVAVAGWIMAATLPTDEAFAPIRAMQQHMLLATLMLTLLVAGLTWWMLRRELSPLLAAARALLTLPAEGEPPQPLPVARDDEIGQLIGGFNHLLETLTQRERALKESEAFKNVILNSVPSEIAVLDRNGVIVTVNEPWTRFATEHGTVPGEPASRTGIGVNYLSVCQAGMVSQANGGELNALEGIRAVLNGKLASFTLEYPCNTPEQRYWFNLMVTPLGQDGDGAVVCHSNITARKLAEQTLAESERRFAQFMDALPAAAFIKDQDGNTLYVNRYLAEVIGASAWLGKSTRELFPPDVAEKMIADDRQALEAGFLDTEEPLPGADGTLRLYQTHKFRITRQAGPPLLGGIALDITERKQAEAALHKSEERLSLVLRGTQDGFWDWDLLRNERYYSPRWWNMLGYEDGELAVDSELWRRLLHPDDLERVRQVYATALTDGTDAYEVEFRLRHKRGHYLDIIARAFVLRDELGRAIRVSGANRDITRRKQMEDALREQEEFFRLIAENLEGFVAVLDVEGRRVYNSPSYTRLLGERNLSGTSSFVDIHPADRERVTRAFRDAVTTGVGQHLEFRFLRADGGILFMESRSGVIRDNTGKTKCIVVVSHDVTARNEAEGRIHHLAFYDALTQLPNRLTLKDRLSQCMAASKRNGCYGALMFLDLDNFKPVNDTHGHEVGDLLLIEAADRLRKCIREIDTVARFGGDEFVVLLGGLHADKAESAAQAENVAEKIRLTLSEPYLLTGMHEGEPAETIEHHCTASIGVALFLNHEGSRDDILKWADAAMYQAKEAGRNRIRFHGSPERVERG
jgi:diguanylate cyclase (GGDEF)-like protein/PAS domain S-box-containing protein